MSMWPESKFEELGKSAKLISSDIVKNLVEQGHDVPLRRLSILTALYRTLETANFYVRRDQLIHLRETVNFWIDETEKSLIYEKTL